MKRSEPFQVTVDGLVVTVQQSALLYTGYGIAGWFEAKLPDGRVLRAAGRWDDPYHVPEGQTGWTSELAWAGGELLEAEDENGVVVEWDRGGGLIDAVSVETLVIEIERVSRKNGGGA